MMLFKMKTSCHIISSSSLSKVCFYSSIDEYQLRSSCINTNSVNKITNSYHILFGYWVWLFGYLVWLLVIGYWLLLGLVIGFGCLVVWLFGLVIGYWLLVIGYWLLGVVIGFGCLVIWLFCKCNVRRLIFHFVTFDSRFLLGFSSISFCLCIWKFEKDFCLRL